MRKRVGIIKRAISLLLIFLLSINSFAAIVSDNDGSTFVTKAEFDALKNSFKKQIDDYNTSIDGKIDGAIAAYLSGIQLSKLEEIKLDAYQNLEFPVYSCVGKESNKHTYKEAGDARFDLSLPLVELQNSHIHSVYSGTADNSGIRHYKDHSTGFSPMGTGMSIIYIFLDKTHADPVTGKYEAAYWDSSLGAWRTNGYRKGYLKLGSEYLVQDLEYQTTSNNWSQSSVFAVMDDPDNPDYRKYWYPGMLGSTATNLKNTTNSTTCNKWYGDEPWGRVQSGWHGINKSLLTDAHLKLMENYDGKNLTLTQFKQMHENTGAGYTTLSCRENGLATGVKTRIDQESKRNKIYSGANAYVNAYPESNIWCYNPVKIGSDWKSDEYFMLKKTDVIMQINDAASWDIDSHRDKAITPYDPYFPYLVPALDGDTDDTNYGENARFSIINANKLYWKDIDGVDHKFNEGLWITKTPKAGGLQGHFKFSEASNEKVWCAFSKKPFDGTWMNADALPVTVNNVQRSKTDLLYDCNTQYNFRIDGLGKNENVYMCFKSSSGTKNP